MLERITDGFYALDREWRFTYLNAAAEQMLERSRDDVLGEVVWDAFAATVATPLYAAYHQAMQEGITTSVDLFYPPLAAWYEVRAYPTPHGLSVFFRDVTRSRALTEELQISEARFRTLVEQDRSCQFPDLR